MKELMSKGLVCESLSSCAMPTLLVPEKDGYIRMCVNRPAMNKIVIKYRQPILGLEDMFDELDGPKFVVIIDLRSGYH